MTILDRCAAQITYATVHAATGAGPLTSRCDRPAGHDGFHSDRTTSWGYAIDASAGAHRYLSTACFHDDHDYCNAMVGYAGKKRPASCKFCEAKCVCSCHGDEL